eukprot:TRINITY_DN5369_c0_g1_i1.p1 TRINITY_DN5369_c0_g1~~TRINITY_DN5369_c0_g1_i1.p1  ORF type:complete len:518 (-),score=75.13 TRINITY_DN5369_c0_g1_i1:96-1424(-)
MDLGQYIGKTFRDYLRKIGLVNQTCFPRYDSTISFSEDWRQIKSKYDYLKLLEQDFKDVDIPVEDGMRVAFELNVYSEEEFQRECKSSPNLIAQMGLPLEKVNRFAEWDFLLRQAERHLANGHHKGNLNRVIKSLPYKAIVKEDLILSVVCNGSNALLDWAQLSLVSRDICRIGHLKVVLQAHDFALPILGFLAHCGLALYQWYHGDITTRQLGKKIASNATTWAACTVGATYGMGLGTIFGGPVGGFMGGIIGGLLAGLAADTISKSILETLFPDGKEEEENAVRISYLEALQYFGFKGPVPFDEVKKEYYFRMRKYHPDKSKDPTSIPAAIANNLAYEIIENYHRTLNEAADVLGVSCDISLENLDIWWEHQKDKMISEEMKRSYRIFRRYLTYNSPAGILRSFLRESLLKSGEVQIKFLKNGVTVQTNPANTVIFPVIG